jgi:hypothetical protein
LALENDQLANLEKKYTDEGETKTPFTLIRDFYLLYPLPNIRRDFLTFYASFLSYERKNSWWFNPKIDSGIYNDVLVLTECAAIILTGGETEIISSTQEQTDDGPLKAPFLLSDEEAKSPLNVIDASCSNDFFENQKQFIITLFKGASEKFRWPDPVQSANYLRMVNILKMVEACYHLKNATENKN